MKKKNNINAQGGRPKGQDFPSSTLGVSLFKREDKSARRGVCGKRCTGKCVGNGMVCVSGLGGGGKDISAIISNIPGRKNETI